ncbi:peptidoglycan DD-metalloendopeptidase family protein [Flavobacterium sp. JLP]|uniref:peptidoglycan DD-metalloendopeptidase family protein n=1 Tax=unclassified Flavobacterium TaxID=196869 RepID=UPI00188D278E|nr:MULTISPECIES: peptidoglycan DD-metalloendopeptidase family protein [unclassified Flavobacterium]MBF4490982.1 peptidoglycan DD-metalloendopeptidase family protein [Flavobacterium sp. MR2016-29]MBF4505105.1 peptidoglycan DD-metalloendopeptidase family protein [Flavobacterium sp. JLP]
MKTLASILNTLPPTKVIDSSIDFSKYVPLDLSITNQELVKRKPENATEFEIFISDYLKKNNAEVAFGGYIEGRTLYKRSTIFKNDSIPERNIHIGLDLWTKVETSVLAPLDGKIHSFKNNLGLGDYGPTIILEHEVENEIFYTLYGHLSLESIKDLTVGKFYKKGEQIATIGNAAVNGDYAPHVHFQIIQNIEDYWGDYPGVCNTNDLNFYIENCPDPNLLLKIT